MPLRWTHDQNDPPPDVSLPADWWIENGNPMRPTPHWWGRSLVYEVGGRVMLTLAEDQHDRDCARLAETGLSKRGAK